MQTSWVFRNMLVNHFGWQAVTAGFQSGCFSRAALVSKVAMWLARSVAGLIGAVTEDLLARQFGWKAAETLRSLAPAPGPEPG